ncbi:MAG: hypothetical protein DGJ47_000768 [Rickettsiaceae bacterium]
MQIISGSNSLKLATKLAKHINAKLLNYKVAKHPDSELKIQINDPISGNVIIVQSTHYPVNDSLMELALLADAVKRAGAQKIIAVIPYFGYSRQNSINNKNAPLAANFVIKMLELSGITQIITCDLHSKTLEAMFSIPVKNLPTLNAFIPYIKPIDNKIIISPDIGSIARCRSYADSLSVDMAIINKYRREDNQCVMDGIIGDVSGKNCIIIDDIVDSAGTLCQAATLLQNNGAKTVQAIVTHAVLSGNALQKINDSQIEKIYISDSIASVNHPKIQTISIAETLASPLILLCD